VQGTLLYDAAAKTFAVQWATEPEVVLTSGHGEEGRGMELSELVLWNGRLYTGDDRSGIVFEIVNFRGPNAEVVPRHIFMEGNGETDKGFKTEWAAVHNDELVVASFGKEYANNDGTIKNKNNNWVVVIDKEGRCDGLRYLSHARTHALALLPPARQRRFAWRWPLLQLPSVVPAVPPPRASVGLRPTAAPATRTGLPCTKPCARPLGTSSPRIFSTRRACGLMSCSSGCSFPAVCPRHPTTRCRRAPAPPSSIMHVPGACRGVCA
jgi:hypothetical protein